MGLLTFFYGRPPKKEQVLPSPKFDDGIPREAYDISALKSTHDLLPKSIYCPISGMPMVDPVLCADGYSYERREIVKWFAKKHTSPYTNQRLSHTFLVPNHNLRNTISELMEPHVLRVSRPPFDPPESESRQ